jgi:hypothetical protein
MLDAKFELTFDYEFWMRLSRIAILRRLPVPLALSRMHQANKSLGQRSAVLSETFCILRQHYAYVPFRWVYSLESHQADGRDHFFELPQYSLRLYLKSLFTGFSVNPNARVRYALEWMRFLNARRMVQYLRHAQSGSDRSDIAPS